MGIRLLKPEEFPTLNILLEKAFKAEKDHRFINLYKEKPMDWSVAYEYIPGQDTDLDLTEKTLVGHVGIHKQPIQFGQAQILDGGIRDVASHPITRGKGYGLRTIQAAKNLMFEQEVDISVLYAGPVKFYEKSGWCPGLIVPHFSLADDQLEKWRQAKKSTSEFDSNKIEVRPGDKIDLSKIAHIYSSTQSGYYFAAQRDEAYWIRHFETRPERFNQTLIAEIEGELLGYIMFNLKLLFPETKEIALQIEEFRVEPRLSNIGSAELDIILRKMVDFITTEAINPNEKLAVIQLDLSITNPIVQHFYHEGYKIEDDCAPQQGAMVIITNPYTLFNRIKPEIQARIQDGMVPFGTLALKFEKSKGFEGGVVIQGEMDKISLIVYKTDAELQPYLAKEKNIAMFRTITDLSAVVCGVRKIDELPSEAVELHGAAKEWLLGLFTNVTFDMYHMDHF